MQRIRNARQRISSLLVVRLRIRVPPLVVT